MNRPARASWKTWTAPAPSGVTIRIDLMGHSGTVTAWGMLCTELPDGGIQLHETAMGSGPAAPAALAELADLCANEPAGAELEPDWSALAALARRALAEVANEAR